MNNLCIHVGFPKTATSYLQQKFFNQIESVHYYDRNNSYYKAIFEDVYLIEHTNKKIKELQKKFKYHIEKLENKPILISDEAWMGGTYAGTHLNFSNHTCMVKLLKKVFPTAKIILTIRRQDRFLESLYKHSIRDGYSQKLYEFLNYRNGSFERYTSFYRKGINIDVTTLNYKKFVDRYIDHFGHNNVLVIPQEALKNDKEEILSKLSKFMNQDINQIKKSNKKINEGLKYYGIIITRLLNKIFIFKNRDGGIIPLGSDLAKKLFPSAPASRVGYFVNWLFLIFTPFVVGKGVDRIMKYKKKEIIEKNLRKKILYLHLEDNIKLQENCLFDLKKYGYY